MVLRFILIFSVCVHISSFAQQEASQWVFGQNAMMDFTSGSPVFVAGSAMVQQEGCASIADSLGNLLFYTNGMEVWDATHTVMPNGSGLLGNNSSTQSSIIVPKPLSCDNYYIFTTDVGGGTNGLMFSEVDMTLNGNNGDVLNGNKNTQLVGSTDEKVAATFHANGEDYWVLTHLNNTNTYHAYLVTSAGVNLVPVVTNIGTTSNPTNAFGGQLKFSKDGSRVGFCHNQAVLEVYDFDIATGILSNAIELQTVLHTFNNNIYTGAAYYGLEFSPNGQVLYASRWFGTPRLAQFDLSSGNVNTIAASQYSVATNNDIYGLQLANDGKIYVARVNQPLIAAINNPNTLGFGCGFTANALNITGGAMCRVTPPSLVSNFVDTGFVGIICAGPPIANFQAQDTMICEGDCINFTDASTFNPDNWQWGFPGANPTFSTDTNPTNICYNSSGVYNVTLIVSNVNGSDTIEKTIIVNQPVSVTQNPEICQGDSLFVGGAWQTTSGTYNDSTLGANGCDSVTVTNLTINPPPVAAISGSTLICEGQQAELTASGGSTYLWSNGSTSQSITTATSGNYSVTVSVGNCEDVANHTVVVKPAPTADAGTDVTIALGGQTGLTATGGGSYSWSPPEGLSCIDCPNPDAKPTATTEYCVKVTNNDGCTDIDCIIVEVEIICGEVFVPNAFSPNGDGENDELCVYNSCIMEMQFQVYDRWGELVFESTRPNLCWDGIYRNTELNPGVFVYKLNATLISGEVVEKKGNVSLVK